MFSIRVYGILINDRNEVLLSKEYLKGFAFTKFPGGGLEQGEGTIDCLRREFQEELNIEIEVGEHLYTTDFYVASAFDPSKQVVSIYYRVFYKDWQSIVTVPFDENITETEGAQLFAWQALEDLTNKDVTFPIDQVVVNKLLK
jgi:8-oxo-dGTP pyrophosphatase MutT (NUDIX family)